MTSNVLCCCFWGLFRKPMNDLLDEEDLEVGEKLSVNLSVHAVTY